MMDITIAIDKLDKVGLEKVKEELVQRGLKPAQVSTIQEFLSISGDNKEKIARAERVLGNTETAQKGIEELEMILSYPLSSHHSPLTIDFTLARGLNYYTGTIFEVKSKNVQIGSVGGGGRYDDLTGLFGVAGIPGVGISFGVDRIYDVMEELSLFPVDVHIGTQVLFFNLGEKESRKAFESAQQLRHKNIRCEVYHEPAKFDKQFKYAEKRSIPFVVIIGDEEMKTGLYKLKNLTSGEQSEVSSDQLRQFSFKLSN
jgi:histidyl-tRNA synthetase